MARVEPALLALFLVSWIGAFLEQVGAFAWAGSLSLNLYPLFILAAALGWVAGNVYIYRRRWLPRELRRRFLLVYFIGPPGILFLLRSMASVDSQAAAPLVPVLSLAVYSIFFLVPITLGRGAQEGNPPRIGGGRV